MSNVISVVSAITGREVASVNTGETNIYAAINQALSFREVKNASYEVRAQLENELRNAYNATTDQEIRSDLLRSIGVDHVKVSVKVTAEDAPAEVVAPAEESKPEGFDVVVNSAVLNAPIAEFNTTDYSLDELKAEAMTFHEVKSSSVSTQLGLIATAREVLAATEGKTLTNEHLSAVGIASVVVGDGGTVAENAATAPESAETPIHDALVAEGESKPVAATVTAVPTVEEVKAPEPVRFAAEPKPVVKTVTKWRGLSNKVAAAVAVAAGIVGAVLGGSIF